MAKGTDEAMCSVTGCENIRYVRGLCSKHYQRYMAHGDADGGLWELFNNKRDAFMSRVSKTSDGCWAWVGAINSNGYGVFRYRGVRHYAHRASLMILTSNFDRRLQVNHKCDNPKCVNPNHLYQGTQKQNIGDMISRGRIDRRGDRAHYRKLSASQVRAIRRRDGATSRRSLATKFGVSIFTIRDIQQRRSWEHI